MAPILTLPWTTTNNGQEEEDHQPLIPTYELDGMVFGWILLLRITLFGSPTKLLKNKRTKH